MNCKRLLTVAAIFVACSITALAQPAAYSSYSAGTTNGATALSWAVIGANSVNSGTPVVTMVDAISDLSTAKVVAYRVTGETAATHTNSTVTLPVVTGDVDSGTILIRHLLSDTYEKRTLTTATGTTNLVVTAAPLTAVIPGDVIYHVTSTGVPAIGVSTNSYLAATLGNSVRLSGQRLLVGQKGKPLLLEINGTAAATLNGATATFE